MKGEHTMSSKTLENILSKKDDNRLAMFIVCCHVDKILEDNIPSSKYDIFIQAGAALTEKRVCELNDTCELSDNISDRNQRYSEMTAMYWAGQNISSDYIGISHYRRRFMISDTELSKLMDNGFDIICTKNYPIDSSIKDNYINTYYAKDWELFENILKEFAPDDYELAKKLYETNTFHPCNMLIFKSEIYKEYCSWIFPILDSFYKQSPLKMDIYQRRDVGFIGERLTSLFVEKKRLQGLSINEIEHKEFKSNNWTPERECDTSDFEKVLNVVRTLFNKNDISKCRRMIAAALNNGGISDTRIRNLALLFKLALEEQKHITLTLFEYLPGKWKSDIDTLLSAYQGLCTILTIINSNPSSEATAMFNEFISSTGFSKIAIMGCCDSLNIKDEKKRQYILSLLN